jgi:non-ribosomal peptide synthetase component F
MLPERLYRTGDLAQLRSDGNLECIGQQVIGCFMNFIPLRIRLAENQSSAELLRTVRRTVLEAQAHHRHWSLACEYRTAMFSREVIQRLLHVFSGTFGHLLRSPGTDAFLESLPAFKPPAARFWPYWPRRNRSRAIPA